MLVPGSFRSPLLVVLDGEGSSEYLQTQNLHFHKYLWKEPFFPEPFVTRQFFTFHLKYWHGTCEPCNTFSRIEKEIMRNIGKFSFLLREEGDAEGPGMDAV